MAFKESKSEHSAHIGEMFQEILERGFSTRPFFIDCGRREGLEETLPLCHLSISPLLQISFASTNLTESLNAGLDRQLKCVKRYFEPSQKQR